MASIALIRCGGSGTTTVTGPSTTRCQASVSNPAAGLDSAGASGTISVTVGRECSWTASSQASWIEITSGKQGQGDGQVGFRVAANPDAAQRTGALMVADRRVDVSQKAAPCHFDVSAATTVLDATGGRAPVGVRANGPCAWTASAGAPWLTVAPQSGSGTAQIDVTAAPNTGPERTASVSVAGQQVTLRQLSTPAQPPPPSPPPSDPTPPPPPPPPTDEPIHLHGRIHDVAGTCPTVRFTVDDRVVDTTAETDYRRGNCKDLLPEEWEHHRSPDVSVDGLLRADGTVEAQRVTFGKH
jgi:hypothetical protein